MIKICGNPNCDAIFHNVPKHETKCFDCNGNIKIINEKTYFTKFCNNFFQYDFITKEYYRLEQKTNQLYLF